jgi:hypothetical protein
VQRRHCGRSASTVLAVTTCPKDPCIKRFATMDAGLDSRPPPLPMQRRRFVGLECDDIPSQLISALRKLNRSTSRIVECNPVSRYLELSDRNGMPQLSHTARDSWRMADGAGNRGKHFPALQMPKEESSSSYSVRYCGVEANYLQWHSGTCQEFKILAPIG